MGRLKNLLNEYGESHQNKTNKLIHWICVPTIFFSIFGLIRCIPFLNIEPTFVFNWAAIVLVFVLGYYAKLSFKMMLAFLPWAIFVIAGNEFLFLQLGSFGLLLFSISIFILAWIGQFIGHGIEGKKPSFLKDLQFLLIGPAWLLNFIFKIEK